MLEPDCTMTYLFQTFIIAMILLHLTACQLTQPYEAPLTPTPEEWKNKDQPIPDQKSYVEDLRKPPGSDAREKKERELIEERARKTAQMELNQWWEVFDDPELNELEEQALASNYNLIAAYQKVLESRAIVIIQRAALYPYVNFTPTFMRSRALFLNPVTAPVPLPVGPNGLLSASNGSETNNGGLPKNVFKYLNAEYNLSFNFQYEVDLWNKIHNSYYAAVFQEQAVTEDYYQILLALTSEVAASYFQLRDLDFQKVILEETIQSRTTVFDILKERYQAGLIPYLDVSRAGMNLTQAEYDSINITRLRGIQENALASLLGIPASVFSLGFRPIELPPPTIPVDLPSEILCRRPDIMEAERKLAAAYAEIGVAYAGFFPSLNLNGVIGLQTPVSSILFNWKARMWEIGAEMAQLVFDAGRTGATVELAKARFYQQLAQYEETVLRAFEEVETALVNLREMALESKVLAESVDWSQLTLDLASFRYKQGLVTFLDVSTAEKDLLQARQTSAVVLGDRYTNTVRLIQALGGGWGSSGTQEK